MSGLLIFEPEELLEAGSTDKLSNSYVMHLKALSVTIDCYYPINSTLTHDLNHSLHTFEPRDTFEHILRVTQKPCFHTCGALKYLICVIQLFQTGLLRCFQRILQDSALGYLLSATHCALDLL